MKLSANVEDLQIYFSPWKLIHKKGSAEELEMYAWYKSDEGEAVVVAVIKRLVTRHGREDYVRFSSTQCSGRTHLYPKGMRYRQIYGGVNGVRKWVMQELGSEWRSFATDDNLKTADGYLKMKKHRTGFSWPELDFVDGQGMYDMKGDVCTF